MVYRYEAHESDPEFIPLATAPTYATYENVTDEHLPSYNEVLAERVRSQKPSRPAVSGIRKVCSLWLAIWALGGLGFIIAGIIIGVRYVNVAYPTPPTAMPYDTAGQGSTEFIVYLLLGAVFLYPVLFRCFQVIFPRFGDKTSFEMLVLNSFFRRTRPRTRKNEGWRNWGICSALSLLYIAGVISAILGTLHLANVKQQNSNKRFSIGDTWAGSYAVLETTTDGSSGALYSIEGSYLGALNLTVISQGWTFQISVRQPIIENIVYAKPVSNITSIRFQFNAFCQSNTTCVAGSVMVPAPPPTYYGDNAGPDFEGNISMIISSPNSTATLNTTNPNVWTSYQAYQGIGENYPPLGYWYLGNDPVVQVVWNTAPSGPCVGLQIYLSRDHEGISLIILGLVWEWWVSWNEINGCEQATTLGFPVPPPD